MIFKKYIPLQQIISVAAKKFSYDLKIPNKNPHSWLYIEREEEEGAWKVTLYFYSRMP